MPKLTDFRDGTTRPQLHVTSAILTFHIVKDSMYFLLYRFTNIIYICH